MIEKLPSRLFAVVAIAITGLLAQLFFEPTEQNFYVVSGATALLLVLVTWLLVIVTSKVAQIQQADYDSKGPRPRITRCTILPGGLRAEDGKPYTPFVAFSIRNLGHRPISISAVEVVTHYHEARYNPVTDDVDEFTGSWMETVHSEHIKRIGSGAFTIMQDEEARFEAVLTDTEVTEGDTEAIHELRVSFEDGRMESWIARASLEEQAGGRRFFY